MNLYRLLLFVTLAVHVSSTSVQPLPDSDSKNVQNPAPSPAPNIPSPSYDSKPLPKGEESKLPLSGGLGQGHTTGDDLVHTNPDAVKTGTHTNGELGDASVRVTKPDKVLLPFDHVGLEQGPDNHDPLSENRNQPPTRNNLNRVKAKGRKCMRFMRENPGYCFLMLILGSCAVGLPAGVGYLASRPVHDLNCPPGTYESSGDTSLFDQAFNGEDGGPKCVNITTATKMKKRGVEGSKKEEEEGTCKVVREGTCPCEAATGTVDSDGKIVEQPGGVKDVKHTKRAVLKAVHRKRTTATI
ncbi:hypothetical protein EV361DRAFT_905502 [Lentinula raphanica]|nr:hypothetical protein EV361DRAFT_905502 [Lentinula raphanica]